MKIKLQHLSNQKIEWQYLFPKAEISKIYIKRIYFWTAEKK